MAVILIAVPGSMKYIKLQNVEVDKLQEVLLSWSLEWLDSCKALNAGTVEIWAILVLRALHSRRNTAFHKESI